MKKKCFIIKQKNIFLFFIFSLLLLRLFPLSVFAQKNNDSLGVAISVQINNKNVAEGDIISATSKGYTLTNSSYDSSIFGVVTKNPAVLLDNTNSTNAHYVTSSGNAYVRISTKNGNISKNDPITSSNIPGIGIKADQNGFVLGSALESYSGKNIGLILVSINPHYSNYGPPTVRTNLLDIIKNAGTSINTSPLEALRYITASTITLLSFILGFTFFGKISAKGVEALGRNPLAARSIQISVIINVILAIAIVGVGLVIAYLILII